MEEIKGPKVWKSKENEKGKIEWKSEDISERIELWSEEKEEREKERNIGKCSERMRVMR